MELSAVALVRGEGIVRRYGGRVVVDVAEIEVRPGEVVAILGPNGAGKSTLFRILLLLESPDAGRVFIGGAVARAGDTTFMRRMSAVFQKPYLFSGTVRENVAYGLTARGVKNAVADARVGVALELLSLGRFAEADVRTLSGGEAQRVGLARALILEPELLALDEPMLHLDVAVRRRFREDIERAARTHARGALLITHDPADAFALADRIAVMEDGRIVQIGTPSEVMMQPGTAFVAELTGAELLLEGTVQERDSELVQVALDAGGTVWGVAAAPRVVTGAAVHVAYRPEDVTITMDVEHVDKSAVNAFEVEIAAMVEAGALVRLRLDGHVALNAMVTKRSIAAMGAVTGSRVTAHLTAAALRVYPATT